MFIKGQSKKLGSVPKPQVGRAKPGKSLSMKKILMTWFLIMGMFPAAVIGVFAYRQSQDTLSNSVGNNIIAESKSAIDMIDRNLFERYGDVQAFAANPHALGTADQITAAANFYMKTYVIYDLMLIVNLDGTVVAMNTTDHTGTALTTPTLIGRSVADQPWFKAIKSGEIQKAQTYYSDPVVDPLVVETTGVSQPSLTFAAPIYGPDGSTQAMWMNAASWQRIVTDILKTQEKQLTEKGFPSADMIVTRKDGLVLDGISPDAVLNTNLVSDSTDEAGAKAAKLLQSGKSGYTVESGSSGEDLIGYAKSEGALGFAGYEWGILTRVNRDEAMKDAVSLRNFMLVLMAGFATLIVVVATRVSVRLVNRLANSVNELKDSSNELGTVAVQLSSNASDVATEAQAVSETAERVSQSMSTVAAAMEQMGASTREIASGAAEVTNMTDQAVSRAQTSNEQVAQLANSTAEIGVVSEVITSIAEQTNLLALNATIEAARAGEAGKGFAVVANEVKELAKATAQATEEIASRIASIQREGDLAVTALAEVVGTINQISEVQQQISAAVEQQTATTSEITRNMSDASDASSDIAASIAVVAQSAGMASSGSSVVQQAGERMSLLASGLQDLLGGAASNGNATEYNGTNHNDTNKNGKKKAKELSQV